MPNLQQHPLRTSTIESPHPTRKQTFQKKNTCSNYLRSTVVNPIPRIFHFETHSHWAWICTMPSWRWAKSRPGGPSGSTWWSKQRIWTTTLRAKGSQHHGWWSLHSIKLLWMLRNIQSILVLDQHGKSWTPKTIACLCFWEIWYSFIEFRPPAWDDWSFEIRGGAQQNTWLTCRMSCLLFTWCWDIWFSRCFLLQSTPYLSRCVIICSTFNPGRMHHEHIYIYIHTHTYTTYLRLHSLSSYHIALTCLDYPYLHFWPISFPFLHRPPGFPELLQQELPTRLTFSQEANCGFQSGIGMFCHRQPGYISRRIPHTFLQEIHRRVHDAGYAQV